MLWPLAVCAGAAAPCILPCLALQVYAAVTVLTMSLALVPSHHELYTHAIVAHDACETCIMSVALSQYDISHKCTPRERLSVR